MTPKPVDTGGVEGGGEAEAPALTLADETRRQLEALAKAVEQIDTDAISPEDVAGWIRDVATEKPTDSMGGEKDKENGASPVARQTEGVIAESSAADVIGPSYCPVCKAKHTPHCEPDEDSPEAIRATVARLRASRAKGEDIGTLDSVMLDWIDAVAYGSGEVVKRINEETAKLTDYQWHSITCTDCYCRIPGQSMETANTGERIGRNFVEALIGEQQTEPATNSVTPQGAQATSKPNSKSTPNNSKDLESAPQPEKREGRYEVGDNLTLRPLFDGVSPPIPVYERLDTHTAAIANAAYLAGQKSQPEGDERSAGEEIKRLVEVAQNGRYDHRTDTFVVKSQLLVQIKHTAKRLAALGSGEGKEQ